MKELEDLKELHELAYGNDKTSWKIDEIVQSSNIKKALLKLDFLEDAIDLPTNCFSTFKNRNGDEVTVMRKERYEEYEKQEKENQNYKQLEGQLDCPLEVFLGFATHRITEIYIEYDDFSGNYASPYCDDEDIIAAYVSGIYDNNEIDGLSKPEWKIETNILTIPLSDYKKHFWLKKDKSE